MLAEDTDAQRCKPLFCLMCNFSFVLLLLSHVKLIV